MGTDFNRLISSAFVLDEEQVRSLAKILQNYAGEPSIKATCTDDADRSFENVEKLIGYENAKSRRITSLALRSYDLNRETSASIQFTCPTPSTPWTAYISIIISGTEEWASNAMRELDEVVTGSRPWYSRISTVPTPVLWPLVVVILGILFFQAGLISSSCVTWSLFGPALKLSSQALFSLATWSLWATWGVGYVLRILFPAGVFLIGQEKARHKTKEKMRWMTITAMVGSILSILVVRLV